MSGATRSPRASAPHTSWLQLPVVVVSAAAVAALLWAQCRFDPDMAYLDRRAAVDWIEYPLPLSMQVRSGALPFEVLFERRFELPEGSAVPAHAALRVRGFRSVEVWLNGARLIGPDEERDGDLEADWKTVAEIDAATSLRPGPNHLVAIVRNAQGPAALWLALDAGGLSVASDAQWTATALGSPPQRARIAGRSDAYRTTEHLLGRGDRAPPRSVRFDLAQRLEQPRASTALGARAGLLIALLLLGGASGWWLAGADPQDGPSRWQLAFGPGLAALLALWVALAFHNLGLLPLGSGFDARGHLDYIAFVMEQGRLPLFVDGGQMFQPPLFYASAAGLLSLFGLAPSSAGALVAIRGFTLAAGLCQIGLIALSLRLLFPGRARAQCFGLLVAALLPAHLYMFQFVTNEGLAATLGTGALTLALMQLRSERPAPWLTLALGLCLGLAILTKLTALPIAAAIVGVLAIARIERDAGVGSALAQSGMLVGIALATCGWYFTWVWLQTGQLVVGGWDPAAASGAWWQDPGYRSAGWLLGFGEALVLPVGSGLASLADGLYSTLWGDGLVSGAGTPASGAPWNAEGVAAGQLLALVPSAAVLLGTLLALAHWWRERSPAWLLIFAVAAASLVGLAQMNLSVPVVAATKAFYALGAALCLCAWGAWGFDAVARHGRLASAVAMALLFAWGGNAYQSHWISADSPRTLGLVAARLGAEPLPDRFEALAGLRPRDVALQRELGIARLGRGEVARALSRFERALQFGPADAAARLGAAIALNALGRHAEAEQMLEAKLESGLVHAPEELLLLGSLRAQRGAGDEALAMFCAAVGAAPLSADAHRALADALQEGGHQANAHSHRRIARTLGSDPSDGPDDSGSDDRAHRPTPAPPLGASPREASDTSPTTPKGPRSACAAFGAGARAGASPNPGAGASADAGRDR